MYERAECCPYAGFCLLFQFVVLSFMRVPIPLYMRAGWISRLMIDDTYPAHALLYGPEGLEDGSSYQWCLYIKVAIDQLCCHIVVGSPKI